MTLEKLAESLRKVALAYPETYEEAPWGDRVVKVRGKIFFFCGLHEGKLYATVKVPKSGRELLKRPYAEPTHYGMGKHGWVSLKFASEKKVPVEELRGWIDESFRAIAPKKLAEAGGAAAATKEKPAKKVKAAGKAILVCADKLRAQRAVKAFGASGIAVDVIENAGKVKLGKAKALIVDIGRNPVEGIALAAKMDASDAAVHLFVAGVRDADQARKLRDLGSAETFRAPPGDDDVVAAVAKALTK
jgi:predicted DNA-binding protein (MmcQ/YjbR family)